MREFYTAHSLDLPGLTPYLARGERLLILLGMRNTNLRAEAPLWGPFEALDRVRRWQGACAGAFGWGPVETASRVVFSNPALTLRAYSDPKPGTPLVLIIPAPIKRAYIWDLVPEVSAVQAFLRSGASVYLVQWEHPRREQQQLGLEDYADGLLSQCLRAVRGENGPRPVILASHSLGGVFASIFAALHPEEVGGLILIGTPLHFGPKVDALSRLVARSPRVSASTGLLGCVPGSFLNLASMLAAPNTFARSRWRDWVASLPDPSALRTHVRVELWTLDEMALPRRLFTEVMEWLYREDRLFRGTLMIASRRVGPRLITTPLLAVVEPESSVVPARSMLPFCEAVQSRDKSLLWYEGDIGVALEHVGPLVGKNAHQKLWPAIGRWVQQHA